MGHLRQVMVALAVCLALAAMAASKEVHELGENRAGPHNEGPWPTQMHNAGVTQWHSHGSAKDVDMDTWGRFGSSSAPGMPGPPYGKPGYKESHNWVSDVDLFSPVVFNTDFYAAEYDIQGQSNSELRQDWLTTGLADSLTAPNCRRGTIDFSLNKYYAANEGDLKRVTDDGKCKKILEQYLKSGIFAGDNNGATSVNIRNSKGEDTFRIKAQETADLGGTTLQYQKTYTLSFWIKAGNIMPVETNIMQFGKATPTLPARSPAVAFESSSTNMRFYIAQSGSSDFHCSLRSPIGANSDGALELDNWYQVTLVVGQTDADVNLRGKVYLNGVEKSTCSNAGGDDDTGFTLPPPVNAGTSSVDVAMSGGGTSSDSEIVSAQVTGSQLQHVKFYADYRMPAAVVQTMYKIESSAVNTDDK